MPSPVKAEVASSISHCSFTRLLPGAFNMGLIGSTCTSLPWFTSRISAGVLMTISYEMPTDAPSTFM